MLLGLVRKLFSPEEEPKASGEPKQSDKKPEEITESAVALAKALEEQKKNSVSKEQYEKLAEENRQLVSQIINGEGNSGNGSSNPPKKADIPSLREKLYGPRSSELSNLEYWKTTLELRKAVMDEGQLDPFLPHGAKITPDSHDVERAQEVARIVQECIDESDGDSGVFTALLQGRTNNDSQTLTAHLKKLGVLNK